MVHSRTHGNAQVIRGRQDAVDMLMHAPDSVKGLRDILAKIKDVPKVLQRLRLTQGAAAKDFRLLTESLANLMLLKHAMLSSEFSGSAHGGPSSMRASGSGVGASLGSGPVSGPGDSGRADLSHLPGIVRKAFLRIDDELQTCKLPRSCSLCLP